MKKYEPSFIPSNANSHHDYAVYRDVRIPMRDGVELAANIIFPAKDGEVDFTKKYPIVLTRTPYSGYGGEFYTSPAYFTHYATDMGCVFVSNATRGSYLSDGKMSALRDDGWGENQHGVDTIKWLSEQPWSNGQIATIGQSYVGYTQYANWLVDEVPDSLVTSAIMSPAMNSIDGGFPYKDEFLDYTFVSWLFMLMPDQFKNGRMPAELIEQAIKENEMLGDPFNKPAAFQALKYEQLHAEYGLLNIPAIRHSSVYKEFLENRDNPEFFKFNDARTRKHDFKKPQLFISTWYDMFAPLTLDGFERAVAEAPSEEIAKGHRLFMGPWAHSQLSVMMRQFPEASADVCMMIAEWLQQQFKGVPSQYFAENPVTLFVMGENRWRSEKSWPIKDQEIKKLYLHSNGHANTMMGKGTLSEELPAAEETPDVYVSDPADPILNIGGHGLVGGQVDQRNVEMRQDVLCYTSAVLKEDVEVTGKVRATLYAATTATDTDFIVKLVDVCPDGNCYNILTGGRRGRYIKNGRSKPEALVPGEINEYQVDLHYTSYVFKKGHKIRVDISSSDGKNFDINPQAFIDLNTATCADYVKATQTIYHDAEHPAVIELPIIPASHERNWIDPIPFDSELTGNDYVLCHVDKPDINLPVFKNRATLPTTTPQPEAVDRPVYNDGPKDLKL